MNNITIIPNYLTNSTALVLPQLVDLVTCEEALHFKFESTYSQYITTYGEGVLGGTYIRIYLPTKIQQYRPEWLERISEYYFWDDGKDTLTREQVLTAICIGDTFDGDEIIFYNNLYYILPRQEENIYTIGTTLVDAIEWLCSSNILTEAFSERNFEPFNENTEI